VFKLLFNPGKFYKEIARTIHLSPILIAVRWIATGSLVTLPLWLNAAVPFNTPWLPIPQETYYFWQLVFILPYGVFITLVLTGLSLLILKGGGKPSTRFRAALVIVSYSLFLPWIACLFWDVFCIFSGHWSFAWVVPVHIAAVLVEGFLYAFGVRRVFGASWGRAVLIAIINCIVFIGLSALIIR